MEVDARNSCSRRSTSRHLSWRDTPHAQHCYYLLQPDQYNLMLQRLRSPTISRIRLSTILALFYAETLTLRGARIRESCLSLSGFRVRREDGARQVKSNQKSRQFKSSQDSSSQVKIVQIKSEVKSRQFKSSQMSSQDSSSQVRGQESSSQVESEVKSRQVKSSQFKIVQAKSIKRVQVKSVHDDSSRD